MLQADCFTHNKRQILQYYAGLGYNVALFLLDKPDYAAVFCYLP